MVSISPMGVRQIELFKLFGSIAVDNSEANKALKETSGEGQKTQGKLSKAFSAIGKGALAVGKTIATGLAVGATAMAGLTIKALNLTGELEQNMGGSEAVFGKYASKMQDTAKKAFENMGLSTSDYLATANKMGALFQGAGFDIEESMTLSQNAMQRAADVASVMGIDTASAMEAVAGAAKGNFTMMDNLGVAMNETTLANYALEKGMQKSYDQMTQQEKIGVAMKMFMEKTGYAANRYAKENETLAGSLSTAKAALTNFLDGSGDVDSLVSSFTNAANVIVKSLTEILPRLTTGLTEIVQKIIPLLPPLLEQLLPAVITGATGLINGLVEALPSILSALMNALPALIQGVQQIFNAIVQALPQLMQSIISALPTLIPILVNALISMIVTLCTMLPQIIQPIIDHLPEIIISIVEALMNNLPALIDGLIALTMGIVAALPQIIQGIVEAAPAVIEMVVTALLNALPQLIMGFVRLAVGVAKAAGQIWSSVKESFVAVFKANYEAIKNVFAPVGEWFGEKFRNAKDSAVNAWSNIKAKFSSIKDKITSAFSNVKEKLSAPFEKARDAIKKVVDKIKGFFSGIKFKWPKLKMPKFSVSPSGWKIGDLLKGSIPKLSIAWNAAGAVFDEPTIFATPKGLQGVGEAGKEAVAPIDVLTGYVQTAVQRETNGMRDQLEYLTEMLASFFPQILAANNKQLVLDTGVLVGEIAPKMNLKLNDIRTRNARGG